MGSTRILKSAADEIYDLGSDVVRYLDDLLNVGPEARKGSGDFDPRFDPRKKEAERLANLEVTTDKWLPDVRQAKLSEFEGRPFVTSMSDRTAAGERITGINGVELNRPVDLYGGQDYMFDPVNAGQVWASAETPVDHIMRLSDRLKKETGKNPVYLPWRMAPSGGDFSTMTGETMLAYAQAAMTRKQKKAFDKAIKNYKSVGSVVKGKRVNAGLQIGDWPGIDDPKSVEVFSGAPDALRKELKQKVMDVQFRNEGGLGIGEARLAVADSKQVGAPDAGLMNVGEVYAGGEPIAHSGHPSYPRGVPGRGIARLDDPPLVTDLLREDATRYEDSAKDFVTSDWGADRGIIETPSQTDIRALQMKPYGGVIDNKMLKYLSDRGYDVGALVGALGLGAASQDSEAGPVKVIDEATGAAKRVLEFWHGTPHRFTPAREVEMPDGTRLIQNLDESTDLPDGAVVVRDLPLGRFDMSKIGTGEGAQAYGHGLYGADAKEVAKGYRDDLSALSGPEPVAMRGDQASDLSEYGDEVRGEIERVMEYVSDTADPKGDLDDFMRDIIQRSDDPEVISQAQDVIDSLDIHVPDYGGALYRVHADIDPDMLLDWDKPLSEQNEAVRDTIESVYRSTFSDPDAVAVMDFDGSIADLQASHTPEEWRLIEGVYKRNGNRISTVSEIERQRFGSGAGFHEHLAEKLGGQDKLAEKLRDAGIPGIRYLDGMSRNAGEGSYNYVMFDDKNLNIVERGNATPEAMAAAATAGAVAAFGQRQAEKRGRWDALREDLMGALGTANAAASFAMEAMEVPWQGLLGATRVAGGLASGEGFNQAMSAGANQVRQPIDRTADQLGGATVDYTGSPALGTAVNVGVNLGGPI